MVIAWTATRARQLTARETGRNFGVYERGLLNEGRGRGREGIGVRPVTPWLHGCWTAWRQSSAVADWLEAGARPNAIVAFRVAAAHCDERERRALFTSQNSNSNPPLLPSCSISSS